MDLTHFDVRVIPCSQKHAMIFARWAELRIGEHFVLVNDHDPIPLYYQFAAQFADAFSWEYLVTGPAEFQVRITRLAASPARPVVPPPSWPAARAEVAAAEVTELDARGLEPPEPMMRILTAIEALRPGSSLRARTDRRPVHLYPELDTRGIRYSSAQTSDESWVTTLRRV